LYFRIAEWNKRFLSCVSFFAPKISFVLFSETQRAILAMCVVGPMSSEIPEMVRDKQGGVAKIVHVIQVLLGCGIFW
jgi:hypothetical protein